MAKPDDAMSPRKTAATLVAIGLFLAGVTFVAGELDRGTMELLMSQPVPRNRLILAHFLVDLVVLPTVCLAFFLGTQFGLATVGDFTPDYTSLKQLNDRNLTSPPAAAKPGEPTELQGPPGLQQALMGCAARLDG